MQRHLIVALAAFLLPFAGAQAQACLGLASLTSTPTNLTVGALFTDGAKALEARVGIGSSVAFGGVAAQLWDHDDVDGTSKGIAIDGGLNYLVGVRKNVSVCPVGTLGYLNHPDVRVLGNNYGSSETYGTAGVAIGAELGTQSTMRLIPFAALQAAYNRFTVDAGAGSESTDETYGLLSGGLSFVLTPTVLLRPHISIPIGLEGSDPTYGVGLSFGFGRR